MSNRVLLIVDGGSKGNSGPLYAAAYAEVHIDNKITTYGPTIYSLNRDGTNNESEYLAIIHGIEFLMKRLNSGRAAARQYHLIILSDSQLVVRQINGIYKVEADHLKPLRDKALKGLAEFGSYNLSWVPRDFTNAYLGC